MTEPVVVAAYDPAWPALFESERALLAVALGPSARIEHVGSTSVPRLDSKPVIDILVGMSRLSAIEARIPALEALSYEYVPEFEDVMPERRYLRKARAGHRTHQIHAVETGGAFWLRHLAFRDHLRAHPEAAREYAALKHVLAECHRDDREAYTEAKGPFIRRVEQIALRPQSRRRGPSA